MTQYVIWVCDKCNTTQKQINRVSYPVSFCKSNIGHKQLDFCSKCADKILKECPE